MTRHYFLIAAAAILLTSIPATAQPRGGGGRSFAPGQLGAPRFGPGQLGGYGGNFNGGYRGPSTGGIVLSLGLGLANNLLNGGSNFRSSYYGNGNLGGDYYGNGYSSGGNYGNGNYSNGYYGNGPIPTYTAPRVVTLPETGYTFPNVVNNPASNPTILPVLKAVIPLGTATGLKITDLYEGTAKIAGLRKGDIILKVDGTGTQSFEELRATLSTGKDKVMVEYIDGTSGETDKRTVAVDDTKIGISVSETAISK